MSEPTALRFQASGHPAIEPIPAFADNYIWLLRSADGTRAAVVDPGDARPVLEALERRGLRLGAVLVTHHHPDHVGGLARLRAAWPDAVVYGPANDAIDGIDVRVGHGDTVDLDWLDASWQVLEVPGHTLDHIAYYAPRVGEDPRPVLLCGDTLFAAGCGRLFEGTPQQMLESLSRLLALPDDTLVCCAHEYTLSNLRFARAAEPGNDAIAAREREAQAVRARSLPTLPGRLGAERETNPFLRWRAESIRRSAATRLGREPASDAEVFAAIRRWKDEFRG